MKRFGLYVALLCLLGVMAAHAYDHLGRFAANQDCRNFVYEVMSEDSIYFDPEDEAELYSSSVIANETWNTYIADFNTSATLKQYFRFACKGQANRTDYLNSLSNFGGSTLCQNGWDEVGLIVLTYLMALITLILAIATGVRSSNGPFNGVAGGLLVCNLVVLFAGLFIVGTYERDEQVLGVYVVLLSILGIFASLARTSAVYYFYFGVGLSVLFAISGNGIFGGGSAVWEGLNSVDCKTDTNTDPSSMWFQSTSWFSGIRDGVYYCTANGEYGGDIMTCNVVNTARSVRCGDCEFLTALRVISYVGFWFLAFAILLALFGGADTFSGCGGGGGGGSGSSSKKKKDDGVEMQSSS